MRWLTFALAIFLLSVPATRAAESRIIKVLPQLLDKKGHTSISPSLYDRDAYQAVLRKHPLDVSGIQFAVQWKATTPPTQPLTIRVEMRGSARGDVPREMKLEATVYEKHWFSHWENLTLNGERYQELGEVTAWRVTLWDGQRQLSEQKSFLW